MTKNTHLEHPEDVILSGDLSVLSWFNSTDVWNGANLSAKIDGSPAIVWGTNPATGNYFVGTKSVFNKKLIKINESHEDIDRNHQGNVATILHECFDYLPQTDGIFQGDFIGFGGTDCYTPNTITYYFPEIVTHKIIIAPHTVYTAEDDLRNAIAHPMGDLYFDNRYSQDVLWFQPYSTIQDSTEDIKNRCKFARQIATLCHFPDVKQVSRIKKQLNSCIRNDIELDDITLEALANDNNCDINVLRLWKLVASIKIDLLLLINTDHDVECYIEEERCGHEGYVLSNEFGTFKIVNRLGFSKANFNLSKMR